MKELEYRLACIQKHIAEMEGVIELKKTALHSYEKDLLIKQDYVRNAEVRFLEHQAELQEKICILNELNQFVWRLKKEIEGDGY